MTAPLSLPDRQIRTIDDLGSQPGDGHRYEIIDGSLLVSPAPPVAHQVATDRLLDAPCLVELRPAELAGPRRRS